MSDHIYRWVELIGLQRIQCHYFSFRGYAWLVVRNAYSDQLPPGPQDAGAKTVCAA